MTALLIVFLLCVIGVMLYAVFSDKGGTPVSSQQPPSLAPVRAPSGRATTRFSGRRVVPESFAVPASSVARTPPRRMLNGRKVPAVKNGRAVIPADAIGLGCLRPISECSLGDRCVCLSQSEVRVGSQL
jgi:hypothetical protein